MKTLPDGMSKPHCYD